MKSYMHPFTSKQCVTYVLCIQALPRNHVKQDLLCGKLLLHLRATVDKTCGLLKSGTPWAPYHLSLLIYSNDFKVGPDEASITMSLQASSVQSQFKPMDQADQAQPLV
jgi:hypothetical protein